MPLFFRHQYRVYTWQLPSIRDSLRLSHSVKWFGLQEKSLAENDSRSTRVFSDMQWWELSSVVQSLQFAVLMRFTSKALCHSPAQLHNTLALLDSFPLLTMCSKHCGFSFLWHTFGSLYSSISMKCHLDNVRPKRVWFLWNLTSDKQCTNYYLIDVGTHLLFYSSEVECDSFKVLLTSNRVLRLMLLLLVATPPVQYLLCTYE